MNHDHSETSDRDSFYSKRSSHTDTGKPLVIALASAVILLGTTAGFKAILAPSDNQRDVSELKDRMALLEGKVAGLERENQRLNDDLYDLRQSTDSRLNQLQNKPSQTTVIQQSGGIRLW